MEHSNLLMILNLSQRETSKDTNWQQTKLIVKNREVDYAWSYGGYPDARNKEEKYKINEEQEKKIIEYIKKNKLNKNIKEIKSSAGIGVSINLTFEVIIENIKTEIIISGRSNIWGGSRWKKKTNLKKIDVYHNVASLISFFKSEFSFDFVL